MPRPDTRRDFRINKTHSHEQGYQLYTERHRKWAPRLDSVRVLALAGLQKKKDPSQYYQFSHLHVLSKCSYIITHKACLLCRTAVYGACSSCAVYSMSHQPQDIHFTVTEEERNQNVFTFNKLKSKNLYFFFF